MPSSAQSFSPRAHILIVDDDPVLRELGTELLARDGYAVTAAENGLEALRVIKESHPDLIISDLRMPKMSGFEFLSIVRRRFPTLPLIAISGEFASSTNPILGIADAFFPKGGYDPGTLRAKVADLLEHPPQHPHLEQPPMWVRLGPEGQVVLTCTDCLRSFPVRACPPHFGNSVMHVECVACGAVLRYCVDTTTSRAMECPALRVLPDKPAPEAES